MRSFFDDIEYACNAHAYGWRYAEMAERVKECERRQKERHTESITISFCSHSPLSRASAPEELMPDTQRQLPHCEAPCNGSD